MNQKSIYLALAITMVLAASLLGYVVLTNQPVTSPPVIHQTSQQQTPTPTQNETVRWHTYRNEKYGFEFRYPADYRIETEFEFKASLSRWPDFSVKVLSPVEFDYEDVLEIGVFEDKAEYIVPSFGINSLLLYRRKTNQWLLDENPICLTLQPIGVKKLLAYQFTVGDAGFFELKHVVILPEAFVDIMKIKGPTGSGPDPNIPKILDTFTLRDASSVTTAQCESWYKNEITSS